MLASNNLRPQRAKQFINHTNTSLPETTCRLSPAPPFCKDRHRPWVRNLPPESTHFFRPLERFFPAPENEARPHCWVRCNHSHHERRTPSFSLPTDNLHTITPEPQPIKNAAFSREIPARAPSQCIAIHPLRFTLHQPNAPVAHNPIGLASQRQSFGIPK